MADALNGPPAAAPAPSAPASTPTGGVGTAAGSGEPTTVSHYTQSGAFRDGNRFNPAEIEAATKQVAAPGQQTLPLEPGAPKPQVASLGTQAAPQAAGTPETPWFQKYGGFQDEATWKSGFQAAAADYQAQKTARAQLETEVSNMRAYIAEQTRLAQQGAQVQQTQPQAQGGNQYLPLESRVAKHFGMDDGAFKGLIQSQNPAQQAQAIEMINEYQVLSNPRIAEAFDKRVQAYVQHALQPFQQQLAPIQQTAEEYQAGKQREAFLAGAQPMLSAVYKDIPDIQSNPTLNQAFAQAVEEQWESVRFCISKGINPFTNIAQSIAYKNQAVMAEAKEKAAQDRLKQTGAVLNATPRVGMADTQTKPANAYENAVRKAATLGQPQEVVDQFWKAMGRHMSF